MKYHNHKTHEPKRRHHVSAMQGLTLRLLRLIHRGRHDQANRTFSTELALTREG